MAVALDALDDIREACTERTDACVEGCATSALVPFAFLSSDAPAINPRAPKRFLRVPVEQNIHVP